MKLLRFPPRRAVDLAINEALGEYNLENLGIGPLQNIIDELAIDHVDWDIINIYRNQWTSPFLLTYTNVTTQY